MSLADDAPAILTSHQASIEPAIFPRLSYQVRDIPERPEDDRQTTSDIHQPLWQYLLQVFQADGGRPGQPGLVGGSQGRLAHVQPQRQRGQPQAVSAEPGALGAEVEPHQLLHRPLLEADRRSGGSTGGGVSGGSRGGGVAGGRGERFAVHGRVT